MPLQNRVMPSGEIVAVAERGTMMGNRGGCLHDGERRLGSRRWVTRQWICCVLSFKGRRRQVMAPGCYTELFFLDEATALAAGHRPCFECRRADALHFAELWASSRGDQGRASAPEIDTRLHAERMPHEGERRLARARGGDVPDGTMALVGNAPHLVHGGRLWPWSFAGYGAPADLDTDHLINLLTPPSIVAVLKSGYMPLLHASAANPR